VARITHGALVANVVTDVTFDYNASSAYILNRSGAAEIYIRVDGVNPTVGGADCDVIPTAIGWVEIPLPGDAPFSVRLISSGTPTYTVKFV
jgi:hypothetical protein